MPVIPEARRYTVQEVLDFPDDGNRYEVVQGELLMSPSPRSRHQILVVRITERLGPYLRGLGFPDAVLVAPADITWGKDPRVAEDLVQPDVFVPDPDLPWREWLDLTRLALAAEVVSPSSVRADRVVKRKTYQRHGVATYWIVDDDAKLVEVWHPGDERPEIVTDILTWKVRESAPELRIPLAELLGW